MMIFRFMCKLHSVQLTIFLDHHSKYDENNVHFVETPFFLLPRLAVIMKIIPFFFSARSFFFAYFVLLGRGTDRVILVHCVKSRTLARLW